ncbi:MAG: hypothetical protein JKY15_04725 [Deltaproteobacteria bacterium]|nr:hypothetical protein [Deltaproteobacteria bacterium]
MTPIKMVFGNEKDLDRRYAYVTSHLTHVMDPDELWQKTFAGLFCVYKYGQVNPDFKGMTLEQIAYARCVPERHQR